MLLSAPSFYRLRNEAQESYLTGPGSPQVAEPGCGPRESDPEMAHFYLGPTFQANPELPHLLYVGEHG